MADLWWLMLLVGGAIFVAFAVLLALGLVRRPNETVQADVDLDRPDRWIVGGGVVLPLIVLVVVFGATLQAMRVLPDRAPPDALVVEITGRQWSYEVDYPAEGIRTTDELRIPVGRPVALRLTSDDVIHSFWVPELGGKMDMLPDGTNTLVVQADEPGRYRARCAEFCGLQHARMQLLVVAEPPDAFAAWVRDRR